MTINITKLYSEKMLQEQWILVDFPLEKYTNNKKNPVKQWMKVFSSVEKWCKNEAGYAPNTYDLLDLSMGYAYFLFEDDATLFKLTWC